MSWHSSIRLRGSRHLTHMRCTSSCLAKRYTKWRKQRGQERRRQSPLTAFGRMRSIWPRCNGTTAWPKREHHPLPQLIFGTKQTWKFNPWLVYQTLKTCGQRYTRPRCLPWPGLFVYSRCCELDVLIKHKCVRANKGLDSSTHREGMWRWDLTCDFC